MATAASSADHCIWGSGVAGAGLTAARTALWAATIPATAASLGSAAGGVVGGAPVGGVVGDGAVLVVVPVGVVPGDVDVSLGAGEVPPPRVEPSSLHAEARTTNATAKGTRMRRAILER